MAPTITQTKDPMTGTFNTNVGNGTAPAYTDLNGGTQVAPPAQGDAYSTFSGSLGKLLAEAQGQTNTANTALTKSKENLVNESLNYSNPAANGANVSPFASIFTGMANPLGSEKAVQGAFAPGITSVEDQIALNNAAMAGANDTGRTDIAAYQAGNQVGRFVSQINPNTGQMDSLDTTTGKWASETGGMGGNTPSNNNTNPTGAFGAYNGNTDPTYDSATSTIASNIKNTIPQVAPETLDAYIKSHSPKSPITGQMLITAASQYNSDPRDLLAILTKESDIGVTGEASRNDNNPGGVAYVGQPGAVQGNLRPANEGGYYARFKSLQDGVMAVASSYSAAQKKTANSTQATNTATSSLGGTFSPDATSRVAQLPAYIQKFAKAGPQGVAYLDGNDLGSLPVETRTAVTTLAAKSGIPIMESGDVAGLKSAMVLYQAMGNMQKLVSGTLSSGIGGHASDTLQSLWNSLPLVGGGNQGMNSFDQYRTDAIKNVQALAGGAGSGLRINNSEILNQSQNLPLPSDSLETANTKIANIIQKLDFQIHSSFPYFQGTPIRVQLKDGQIGTVSSFDYSPSTMQALSPK